MPPPRDDLPDQDVTHRSEPPVDPALEGSPTLTNPPGLRPHSATRTNALPGPVGGAGGSLPEHFGRYRIEKTLGFGGMGSVFLAQDTELHRRVALKVPFINETNKPRVLARFRREAQSAATLVHPNICPVYDVGEIDGIHYLTMAFIEGQPLSTLIPVARGMEQGQVVDIVYRVALALEEAHQKGIIHRDLKPSNIMINARGEPIVMDFGLAYLDDESDGRLTQAGAPVGTPCYMDPEQISGDDDEVRPTRDVYSLGVLLYEMLTGRLPFTGKTTHQILARAIVEDPVPPSQYRPDLDPKLEAICLKAMAKRSQDRYPTMAAVAQALEPLVWTAVTSGKRPLVPRITMPQCDVRGHTTSDFAPPQAATTELRPSDLKPRSARRGQPSTGKRLAVALLVALPMMVVGAFLAFLMNKAQPAPEPDPVPPPPITRPEPNPNQPVKEKATVRLRLSDPDAEATLFVDNVPAAARAPLQLTPGVHKLRVVGPDIDPVERELTVNAGTNADIDVPLVTFGLIRILDSDPGVGVTATLDGESIEPATLAKPRRITTGSHTVKIEGKDIDTLVETFGVRRGANPALALAIESYGSVPLVGNVFDGDCTIKLDGKALTKEAARKPLRLKVGSHRLKVSGDYLEPIEQEFRVVRGSNSAVKVEGQFQGELLLKPSPAVKDATLEIDGKTAAFKADTPLRLSVGTHALRLKAAGYHPAEIDVLIRRGMNPPRSIFLEKIDPIATAAKKFTNALGMELVRLEAGTVQMGSPPEQEGHRENEEPRTEKIARPFYIGAHEVTVGAFRTFAEKAKYRTDAERSGKGSWRFDPEKKRLIQDPKCTWQNPGWKQADDEPVVCVTWDDAQAFCQWLSKQEGHKYRLPTEAEWEYACRAGSEGPFHYGESLDATQANFDGSRPYGKADKGIARNRTTKVGSFKPNEWGLYDMHGNAWEWCADVYRKTPTSPPRTTVERVIRGGSWFDPAGLCRSAYRSFDEPSLASPNLGFRIVCEAKDSPRPPK